MLLSDVDGLYSADPHKNEDAKLIEEVYAVSDSIMALGGGEGSALGTGGMKTKLRAAKLCTENGCNMVIANGKNPELLYDIVTGVQGSYTKFFAK